MIEMYTEQSMRKQKINIITVLFYVRKIYFNDEMNILLHLLIRSIEND